MTTKESFLSAVSGAAKGAGLAGGAKLGLVASASVWNTAIATGTAAIVSPAVLCVALPVVCAYIGWRAVKKVTDEVEGRIE
jgi:hypothetical protein